MVSLGVCSWYFCPQFDVFPFAHSEQWKTPVGMILLTLWSYRNPERKGLKSSQNHDFEGPQLQRHRKGTTKTKASREVSKSEGGIEVITLPETNIAPKNDGFQ